MSEVRTTCPYCGVGCGVIATEQAGVIVAVRGDPQHPANLGRLCTKGSTLHLSARAGGRLLEPRVRAARAAPMQPASWDAAMSHATGRFARIVREHGPDAVAFYGSGQLLTEDYYVLNKLARAVVGTNNIDTNSRLCMSSAVAGYKATLGADAVPACYEDIDHADLLFVAGSNTAWAHPVLMRRIEAARARRARAAAAGAGAPQRMIVVDPRRTETARAADLHLPILPGTDVMLFHAMLHWWLWEQRIDEDFVARHCEGLARLRRVVRDCSPRAAAAVCGLPEEDIVTAARWWADAGSVLSLYCQGLNQSASGTDKNATLVTLHLATGQIGRPGAGPLSLTGQPNAMGGREVGALANLLPGHRDAADPAHRAEVAAVWQVDALPDARGLTAVELFDALERREVRAVWIACTNPAESMPDVSRVRRALERAELVVVQEAFADAATARYADVLLPATTWGEKHGTVTNSERRVSRVRAVLPPAGQARHDWAILADAGRRLEELLRPRRRSGFGFASTEAIWDEHRALTLGRDLDLGGLDYAVLERDGPQQWPYPAGATGGTARLFADGRFATPNGRATLWASPWRPVAEPVDARYPLALNTGRLRDQWHTMTRSGRVPALFGAADAPRLAMHANDLARRGIADGDLVSVESRRGRFVAIAAADADQRSGQVQLPMHWGSAWVRGRGLDGVNALASRALDPVSRQPELKHAAVRVARLDAPWRMTLLVVVPPQALEDVRERLLTHAQALDVAWAVPAAATQSLVWLRAANLREPDAQWVAGLDAMAGLDSADVARYDDPASGRGRRIRIAGGRLVAARVSGPDGATSAEAFAAADRLRALALAGEPVAALVRSLLSPRGPGTQASAPAASRTLCLCHGVSEACVLDALARAGGDAASRVAQVQASTRCGTGCGSCVADLKRLACGTDAVAA